jgi:hypothetical protein
MGIVHHSLKLEKADLLCSGSFNPQIDSDVVFVEVQGPLHGPLKACDHCSRVMHSFPPHNEALIVGVVKALLFSS